VEPVRLESGQSEVETAEYEITQLTAQQIGIPTPPRGQFIVGQAIGLFLLLAPALRDDRRDRYRQPQLRRGGDPAVSTARMPPWASIAWPQTRARRSPTIGRPTSQEGTCGALAK